MPSSAIVHLVSIAIIEEHFRPETRRQGQKLLDAGAVSIVERLPQSLTFFVRASEAIKTNICVDDLRATLNCSCKKRSLCKHLWASLLLAVQKQPDFLHAIKSFDLEAKVRTPKVREPRVKSSRHSQENIFERYAQDERQALQYFSTNGFELAADLNMGSLVEARKKLARVFHPDRGGTHEEVLELNQYFEILKNALGAYGP